MAKPSSCWNNPVALGQNLQMAGSSLAFVGFVFFVVGFVGGGGGGNCINPVKKDLKWGTADDWDMAEHICCHNTQFAEPSGYFATENLFSQLRREKTGSTITFYDSVCGLPLFEAPIGRSMEAFEQESDHHGWPSFRPEEINSENVIINMGGEMASVCGTHLGHNLPDGGGDRYCIDLVCIAGQPRDANVNGSALPSVVDGGFRWDSTSSAYLCFALAVVCCLLSSVSDRVVETLSARKSAARPINEDLEPGAAAAFDAEATK